MSASRLVPAALAVLASAGCNGADTRQPTGEQIQSVPTRSAGSAGRPALCARLRSRVTGRVSSPAASELSGLAVSRSQSRVLWSHNDSGDAARLLALSPAGRLRADVAVPGAEHIDWEDIATGPAAGPRDALYIGDIGDNEENRQSIVVYRVVEPALGAGAPRATAQALRLNLRYPDHPHDSEALLVDPATGALVIVTKDFGGVGGIYVASNPSGSEVTTMRRSGKVSLGAGQAITAGDVSANGRTIALRSYDSAFVWSRRRGQTLRSAMRRRPCRARVGLLAEGQGEALALARDGRAFFTVAEGRRAALRRYGPVRPYAPR